MLCSSELWKTGALRTQQQELADITHGSCFRRSYLSAIANREEAHDLRVGLILGYDDLELCNPLGAVRTKHKTACFYIAIANLPAERRFIHNNMCVLMLVLEKVLSRCGAVRVVAGADAVTGEVYEEDFASFGSQLRSSMAGKVHLQVCVHDLNRMPSMNVNRALTRQANAVCCSCRFTTGRQVEECNCAWTCLCARTTSQPALCLCMEWAQRVLSNTVKHAMRIHV